MFKDIMGSAKALKGLDGLVRYCTVSKSVSMYKNHKKCIVP